MSENSNHRKDVFLQVALAQLSIRTYNLLRSDAKDSMCLCPGFLKSVETITDAILTASDEFAAKLDQNDVVKLPMLLKETV